MTALRQQSNKVTSLFPSSFYGHCARTISLRHCLRSCWLLIFNTCASRLQSPLLAKQFQDVSTVFGWINHRTAMDSVYSSPGPCGSCTSVRSGKDMSLFRPWLRFRECCTRVFLEALPGCRSGFRLSAASHRAVSKEKCRQGSRDIKGRRGKQCILASSPSSPHSFGWGVDGQVQEPVSKWLVGLSHASTWFCFFGVRFDGLHPG